MTIDLDALESAAKAATPGPWETKAGPDFSEILANSKNIALVGSQHKDAAYIAAVSPDVVLELIAELRAEREKYINAVKAYKAAVQEGKWLAFQVYKPRKRCPPLQECNNDDIVTENDCLKCWLKAASDAVEEQKP